MNKNHFYSTQTPLTTKLIILGYVFQKGQSKTKQFKFGISRSKLEKYNKKIDNIILEYKETANINALSLKLDLFFKRIVYYGNRKNDDRYRWQVRGISDSYKELKRFMKNNKDFNKITKDTQNLFSNSIIRSFNKNGVSIPAKINNHLKNDKFIANFYNNRALLLHPKIGLTYHSLIKIMNLIFINENFQNYSFNELSSYLLREINKKE